MNYKRLYLEWNGHFDKEMIKEDRDFYNEKPEERTARIQKKVKQAKNREGEFAPSREEEKRRGKELNRRIEDEFGTANPSRDYTSKYGPDPDDLNTATDGPETRPDIPSSKIAREANRAKFSPPREKAKFIKRIPKPRTPEEKAAARRKEEIERLKAMDPEFLRKMTNPSSIADEPPQYATDSDEEWSWGGDEEDEWSWQQE